MTSHMTLTSPANKSENRVRITFCRKEGVRKEYLITNEKLTWCVCHRDITARWICI